MQRKFYVYGYLRMDTNTYFYIGKGTGKRIFDMNSRNSHFLKVVNLNKTCVEFSDEWKQNLSKAHMGQKSGRSKPVRCIELNLYFDSGDEAIRYMKNIYGLGCSKLKEVCNGNREYSGTMSNGVKLHWEWAKGTPATTERENSYIEKQQSELQI